MRGPARVGALPTLALMALTATTAVTCRRVFADWQFLPLLLAVGLGTHVVLAGCRALRVHLGVATPFSFLVAAIVITRGMYPESVQFAVLPSRLTWDLAVTDLRDAWHQFPTAVAPVPSADGFLLATAIAMALIAYTSDTFGFRAFGRVEAVVPSGVVFTFVAALGEEGNESGRTWSAVAWLVAACVAVALLRSNHGELGSTWLGGRRRERMWRVAAGAATLAVLTAGVAYTVAPRLPGAGAAPLIDPGSDDGPDRLEVISPIVDIRARLVNRSNRVLFRVQADRPNYWHLTSLSEFDGSRWSSDEKFVDARGDLGTEPLGRGSTLVQRYTIEAMGDGWVPAALEAVSVNSRDDLVYNRATGTLRMAGDANLYGGMTYTVTSVVADHSVDELRAATVTDPPGDQYRDLPRDFPEQFRSLAASITEGAATPYDQARALQDWFRANFEYDVNVPAGHSDRAIETFLNQRRGYCEQFAGTFAAFGRAVGLPTRVAIGFTPGVFEDGRFVVRGRNAHAWPEVWFDGLGWVLFEPTPGRGAPGATDYTGVAPAQDERVGEDTGPTGTVAQPTETTVAPRPTTTVVRGPADPTATTVPSITPVVVADGGSSFPTGLAVATVLVLLGAAWLLGLPALVTAMRRRRRVTPADRVTGAWSDATAALALVGAARRDAETPVEHAERAWKSTGIEHATLTTLAQAATRAVYAAATIDDEVATECERLRHEVSYRVRARAPWRVRMRSRLDPRLASSLR